MKSNLAAGEHVNVDVGDSSRAKVCNGLGRESVGRTEASPCSKVERKMRRKGLGSVGKSKRESQSEDDEDVEER